MQYGSTIHIPPIGIDEVVEVTKKKKYREPFPGYTILGNGKETKLGGKSMDILDICKQLNTAEMNLLQVMRDEIERSKYNKEKNVNLVVPTRILEWTTYLGTALKKNYAHMNKLDILRRVKRGTYMVNPLLFIPPRDMEYHTEEWHVLAGECND